MTKLKDKNPKDLQKERALKDFKENSYFEIIDTEENKIKFEAWLRWLDKCWTRDVKKALRQQRKLIIGEVNELLLDQLYRLEGVLGKYNCQHGGTKCNFQTNCHRLIRTEIDELKIKLGK